MRFGQGGYHAAMTRNRLEAFSDGVIAILITIMVLELTIPHLHHDRLTDLWHLRHIFLSYVVSFVYLAIYWNNHHHVLYLTERVGGGVLWANMHLLFWLSLVPFATGWMGENDFAPTPTAVYGVVLLMAAIAYYILVRAIIHGQGTGSARQSHRQRLQRQDLGRPLRCGHPPGTGRALGLARRLRPCRRHLAYPRPPHREGRARLRERGGGGLPDVPGVTGAGARKRRPFHSLIARVPSPPAVKTGLAAQHLRPSPQEGATWQFR